MYTALSNLRGNKDELSVPVPEAEVEQLLGNVLPVDGVQENVPLVKAPAHQPLVVNLPKNHRLRGFYFKAFFITFH